MLPVVLLVAAPLVPFDVKTEADVARAIREHYTKHAFEIPMRDGVRLYTDVFTPKDRAKKWPILLNRTPYGLEPYGVDNTPTAENKLANRRFAPAPGLVQHGFIFVHQDVRGRMMSDGEFVDVRPHRSEASGTDESTDAYDTVDWLVKNVPSNNGRVGVWGISYGGLYAAQAAVDAHPAVKAVSPQAPVTEWFLGDDFHHNGAFLMADALLFFGNFGKKRVARTTKMRWDFDPPRGDLYDFFLQLGPLANANARYLHGEISFWNELMQHGTRDAWWAARDPRPYYRAVKPAVLTVGGWFDGEDVWGALATYRAFEQQSPGADNAIVMGPWRHGGWARTEGDLLGDVGFQTKTSLYYREQIIAPFFLRHLKGEGSKPAEATVFETGTNEWRSYDRWPPAGSKPLTLYLQDGHALATTPPAAEQRADHYVSDPAKPVPYTMRASADRDPEYMTEDQRFAARRPDVLVYTLPPQERALTASGPITVDLWVSTTGTDADFVVKLIDVYPDDVVQAEGAPRLAGYQQLVRGEVMRGKFRDSMEKPAPFVPEKPARVRFALPDVAHTFRAGHRVMIQVQSSWFPLVDRNPQSFVDIYTAKEGDFVSATQTIHRQQNMASSVTLSVLP
jgi:putative CocE/NonD family hydrolase